MNIEPMGKPNQSNNLVSSRWQPPASHGNEKTHLVGRCRCRGSMTPTALFLLALLALTGGCARPLTGPPVDAVLFSSPPAAETAVTHAPAFLVERGNLTYNRIGTPGVRVRVDGLPEVIVDPETPTVYHERARFSTSRGHYTNEIYRVHFEEVPFGWGALNLTAGKNPGLLVIYTLNERGVPVLITTAHTCGCYLAFFPTAALPAEAYPAGWPDRRQWIYGHTLPSRILTPDDRRTVVFTLADQTHRIGWVTLLEAGETAGASAQVTVALAPMHTLYRLPFRETTVSFFETEGKRAGYVKNNSKPLERLLIGWWAFDFRVGEDKAFGADDDSGVILYTSLKFWAREESDLKNFPRFLAYWGWGL